MKKYFLLLFISIVLLHVNSCKNDLDAMAPYKESVVVYGMIDPSDSVNFIRVNRVFLGAGDANQIAQIQDSVYFKPGEATVVVEKYWNGALRQKYNFYETYEVPLSPGVFNTNQLIYKSIQKFKSDSSGRYFEYVLKVTNVKTGTIFDSEKISLVKDITTSASTSCASLGSNCFFNDPNAIVSISPYQNAFGAAQTKIKFATPKNSITASVNLEFFYTETYLNTTSVNKKFEYPLGDAKASTALGGEVLDFSFAGYTFFNALNSSIPDDNNVLERIADSVVFHFYFGGNELQLYKEINNTSGSFGQEKPIYTNMKNGAIGVFSSRTKYNVTKKVYKCNVSSQVDIISVVFLDYLRDSNYPYCRMRFRGVDCPINSGC